MTAPLVVILGVAVAFGVRWALITMGTIAAVTGGLMLWDRWRMGPASPPDPNWLAEVNQPQTATELAACLADYVADLLTVAHLGAADRRRLEDLEQRLRVQAGGRRLEDLVSERRRKHLELAPYTGDDVAAVLAVLSAEGLLSGRSAQLEVAEWSTPASADAEALTWFVDNFERVWVADERERLAPQASSWRRLRAVSRR